MSKTYQRIVLASRPQGAVTPDNFRLETVELPELQEGQVLVRNHFPVARSVHARPHERQQVLCAAAAAG